MLSVGPLPMPFVLLIVSVALATIVGRIVARLHERPAAASLCACSRWISMHASLRAAEPTHSKLADRPATAGQLEKQGLEILGEFDAPGDLRRFAG